MWPIERARLGGHTLVGHAAASVWANESSVWAKDRLSRRRMLLEASWATLRAAVATTSTDAAFIAVVAATAVHWLAADASASRQVEQPAPPRLPHLILPQRRVASQLFVQDQGWAAAAKRAEHSWC